MSVPRMRSGIVLVLIIVIFVNWFSAGYALAARSTATARFDTWEFASRGLNMRKLRLIGGIR